MQVGTNQRFESIASSDKLQPFFHDTLSDASSVLSA
jgi:hypothetical protein